MAFPLTPLEQTVEIQVDGTWTDITDYVMRDPIQISRGRADESSSFEPSQCQMTLNNRDGRFSPRNPSSPYYGKIGRNTPIRVLFPSTENAMFCEGGVNTNQHASAPDSANLSITGDIDLRVELTQQGSGILRELVSKYVTTGNQRSYRFRRSDNATGDDSCWLFLSWSTDGTSANTITVKSTVQVGSEWRKQAFRATLDVNNGSGGYTVTFYTSDDGTLSGTWVQLGDQIVTTGGTTSIFNSTASAKVGAANVDTNNADDAGLFHKAEIRSGIGGTVVANPDFDQALSTTSFADTAGSPNTWTVNAAATFVEVPNPRFVGEVAAWPQRWDTTGTDVYVPLEAAGIGRRLGQGAAALKSTMFRSITGYDPPAVAYWPCEDGEDADQIAAGLVGMRPMRVTPIANANLAAYDEYKCSEPIPTLSETKWTGFVPDHSTVDVEAVSMLVHLPDDGLATERVILRIFLDGGGVHHLDITVNEDGAYRIYAENSDHEEIDSTSYIAFDQNGVNTRMWMVFDDSTADITFDIYSFDTDGQTSGGLAGTLVSNRNLGTIKQVTINPDQNIGAAGVGASVGHIAVFNDSDSYLRETADGATSAFKGEPATERMTRLGREEGVDIAIRGSLTRGSVSQDMGPQLVKTFLELIEEAAESDGGILYEPREFTGIAYRTRESLYTQAPAVTFDYDGNDLSAIEPVEDDQATRNDITVNRVTGSSIRVALEEGALSVNAPPDGIGRYDSSVELSLVSDGWLDAQAAWRLAVGTVDEARYPVLGVRLERDNFDDTARAAVRALDVGDRVTVTDPPAWIPPEDINQLAQGVTETLHNFEHSFEVNCSPYSPYAVAEFESAAGGAGVHKFDSEGATLASGIDTDDTSLTVDTTWTAWTPTDAEDGFDILIGGEQMTVTDITALSGDDHTFTVTRSVNGVVKSHSSGAEVRLFNTPRFGLGS